MQLFDSTGSFEVKKSWIKKNKEVLDICLASESPEVKARFMRFWD